MLSSVDFRILAAGVVLAVSIGGTPSFAQEDGEQSFGSEVDVTVVNIDVFVRDSEGRPVDGLQASDFKVTQGGVEMPVTNFSVLEQGRLFLEVPVVDGEVPVELAVPKVKPAYVLLYIDNEYIQPMHRKRMMGRVRGFVEETMQGPVQMGVASSRRSLDLRQPFTDDREAVLDALKEVSHESSGWHVRNRERQRIYAEMDNYAADRDSRRLENTNQTNYDFLTSFTVKSMIWSYIEAESDVLVDSLAAMRQAVEMVAGVDGRKAIVYMSGGLPMTPGRDLMEEYAQVFQDHTIFNELTLHTRMQDFRSLATVANGHRVRIYSLDASGLNPPEGFGAEDKMAPEARASWVNIANSQESLGYMADSTGALAVMNTNDFEDGLGLIRDDLFNYYSLGYTIPAVQRDSEQQIRIELPDHPGLNVRYRRSITEKSATTQIEDQVKSALYRDTVRNSMGLTLTCGTPERAKGKRWQVPFDLAIPLRNLEMVRENDDWVAHVEIFLSARDDEGKEMKPTRHDYVIRIPARGAAAPENALYRISLSMLFRDQRHTVSVGVKDQLTQRTSYARTEVELP